MEKSQPAQQQEQKGTPRVAEPCYANWFHVSGDLDDFIFFGEDESYVSER